MNEHLYTLPKVETWHVLKMYIVKSIELVIDSWTTYAKLAIAPKLMLNYYDIHLGEVNTETIKTGWRKIQQTATWNNTGLLTYSLDVLSSRSVLLG